MRRFLLLCLVLLAVSTVTLAQRPLRAGIKAGLNASTYQGREVPDPGYRWGPTVGLLAQLPLGAHVSLQPELLYEQQGATTDLLVNGPYSFYSHSVFFSQQTRSRLHYLSLPVLVRVQAGKWFAVAGPQVSYLLSAREQTTSLLDDPYTFNLAVPVTNTYRGTRNFHRGLVSEVAGVGCQVLPQLAVEVRYVAAVTKLRQSSSELQFWPDRLWNARTSNLQAQLSYTFATN